jgi:hypothetical protein
MKELREENKENSAEALKIQRRGSSTSVKD